MAFIPQDDDEKQKQGGMDVLAPGAPQQPGQAPGAEGPQVVSGPGAGIGTGGAQQQAPQQAAGKPKGSGMFTDVRKYRQANVPQAGKMAQAITGKQQREAGKVGQAVQKQQQQYQQRVGEQQAKMGQARQFALQQLSQAGQQGTAAPAEDVKKFRDIMTGQTRYTDVGNLGVGQQAVRAKQLQALGQGSERAAGARKLLEQTFGKNQYTRGQKTLDELILGADPAARQQIVSGTRGAAEGVTQQIRDARMKAIQDARGLTEEQTGLRTGLQEQLGTSREQVQTEVEQRLQERQDTMRQQQEAMQQAFATGQITADQMAQFTTPEALEQAANKMEQMKQELRYNLGGAEFEALQRDPAAREAYAKLVKESGGNLNTYDDLVGEMQQANRGQQMVAREGETARDWLARTRQADKDKQFGDVTSELTQSFGPAAVARKLMESGLASTEQIDAALAEARTPSTERKAALQSQIDDLTRAMQGGLASGQEHVLNMRRQALQKELGASDRESQAKALSNLIQGMDRFDPAFLTGAIQQDLAKRGASPSLYKDFIEAGSPEDIGLTDVITEDQLARQNALAALADQQGMGIGARTERTFEPGTLDVAGLFRKLRGI